MRKTKLQISKQLLLFLTSKEALDLFDGFFDSCIKDNDIIDMYHINYRKLCAIAKNLLVRFEPIGYEKGFYLFEADDDYSGTLSVTYNIGGKYIRFCLEFGSCSVCDTMEHIMDDFSGLEQKKQLLNVLRDLLFSNTYIVEKPEI